MDSGKTTDGKQCSYCRCHVDLPDHALFDQTALYQWLHWNLEKIVQGTKFIEILDPDMCCRGRGDFTHEGEIKNTSTRALCKDKSGEAAVWG